MVLSRISSRSNSASAANIPNTSRPPAVVVSMLAPWPVSARKPAFHQLMDRVDEVAEVAPEAIELPDDQTMWSWKSPPDVPWSPKPPWPIAPRAQQYARAWDVHALSLVTGLRDNPVTPNVPGDGKFQIVPASGLLTFGGGRGAVRARTRVRLRRTRSPRCRRQRAIKAEPGRATLAPPTTTRRRAGLE
jgi:hypothetical protein